MKTLEIKLKKDVLIVESPLDAYDVSIGTHCIGVRTNENVEKDTNGFYHIYKKGLFFGDVDIKLEFICKGSELTEEIASELVKTTWIHDIKILCKYKNYNSEGDGSYFSAVKSFISAVESKGFYWLKKECDNQFCENGKVDLGYKAFFNCQVCEELEEKTFKNPLIFVKNA